MRNAVQSVNIAADGIYARTTVIYGMDAAWSNGAVSAVKPANAAYDPTGFSSRGLQLGSYSGGNFVQVGYTAGCGQESEFSNINGSGCTGLTSSFGLYKRIFIDGEFCVDDDCDYYVQTFNPVSGDDVLTFQIQRNLLPEGPSWRFYANGVLLNRLSSWFGFGTARALAERPGRSFTGGVDRPVVMTGTWTSLYWHRNGAASANPPGTLNYQTPVGLFRIQDFAPACPLNLPTTQRIEVNGRC